MNKWLVRLVWLGVAALAAATLAASFGGDGWWLFGLFPHFRPHLMTAGLIWLLVAAARHQRFAAMACAAMVTINALPVLPYISTTRPAIATVHGTPMRMMTFNLHGGGTRPEALVDFIQTQRPDAILLTELPWTIDWLNKALGDDYPYRVASNLDMSHDVMLLSRWPIKRHKKDYAASEELPVMTADLCAPQNRAEGVPAPATGRADETCVRVIGMHAIAPFGSHASEQRIQFLRAALFAKHASDAGRPVIMAGDFNAAPWSPIIQRLFDDGVMTAASRGHGLTGTWTSRLPMVGLVIDHVFTSHDVSTRSYVVGADLGSDHLPVVADVMLPAPRPRAQN